MSSLRHRFDRILAALGQVEPGRDNPELVDLVQPVVVMGDASQFGAALRAPAGWGGGEMGTWDGAGNSIPTMQVQALSEGGCIIERANIYTLGLADTTQPVVFWRVTQNDPLAGGAVDATTPLAVRTIWWEGPPGQSRLIVGQGDDIMDGPITDSPALSVTVMGAAGGDAMRWFLDAPTWVPPGWWFTMQAEAIGNNRAGSCAIRVREVPA